MGTGGAGVLEALVYGAPVPVKVALLAEHLAAHLARRGTVDLEVQVDLHGEDSTVIIGVNSLDVIVD